MSQPNKLVEQLLIQDISVGMPSIVASINAARVGIIYNPWMCQNFLQRQSLSRVLNQELDTTITFKQKLEQQYRKLCDHK